jgi:hypothetical protein
MFAGFFWTSRKAPSPPLPQPPIPILVTRNSARSLFFGGYRFLTQGFLLDEGQHSDTRVELDTHHQDYVYSGQYFQVLLSKVDRKQSLCIDGYADEGLPYLVWNARSNPAYLLTVFVKVKYTYM